MGTRSPSPPRPIAVPSSTQLLFLHPHRAAMAICYRSPVHTLFLPPQSNHSTTFKQNPSFATSLSHPNLQISTESEPVFTSVRTFAPATVANLGPGFYYLGCAIDGIGDYVSRAIDPSVHTEQITIAGITYPVNTAAQIISKDPLNNCAGIAAIAAMKSLEIRSVGLSLTLEKGLPLGSGLGSSATSSAAAAVAVTEMFRVKLSDLELVQAGLQSEAKVSGYMPIT